MYLTKCLPTMSRLSPTWNIDLPMVPELRLLQRHGIAYFKKDLICMKVIMFGSEGMIFLFFYFFYGMIFVMEGS